MVVGKCMKAKKKKEMPSVLPKHEKTKKHIGSNGIKTNDSACKKDPKSAVSVKH